MYHAARATAMISEAIQDYGEQRTKQPNYRRRKSHDKKEYLYNLRVSIIFSFTHSPLKVDEPDRQHILPHMTKILSQTTSK